MHTKDLLAQALDDALLPAMAAKAREGYYHDYLSPIAMPCMQLAHDLRAVGTQAAAALLDRHLDGEFDASSDEGDEWIATAEGQDAMGRLGPGLRRAVNDA